VQDHGEAAHERGFPLEEIQSAGKRRRVPIRQSALRALPSDGRTAVRCRGLCRAWRWSSTLRDHSCPCCRNDLHRIGEDVSERLDIVPAQLRGIVVRPPQICAFRGVTREAVRLDQMSPRQFHE
jgi:hypothetical protein